MRTSYRPQIGLAFFGFLLIGGISGAVGVLLPSLSSYYNVDNSVLGLFFFASTLGYLMAAFSTGPLTEKLGRRWFLTLGAAALLSGSFIIVLKPPFVVVLVMGLLLGLGMGSLDAGFNAYVAALPRSTAVMNNLHAFYGVGALLGPITASAILAVNWGWNNVYLLWAVVSVPLLIGCGLLFRPQQSIVTPSEDEPGDKKNILLTVLKLRVVWLAMLFLLFYVGIEVSLGNWGYSFLIEDRHQGTLLAGWIVSGYWLGLTLGRFVLANVFERLGWSIYHLLQASMLIVLVGTLLVWFLPLQWVAACGLLLIGFGLGPIYPTIIALTPGLVPARLVRGTIGFIVSVSIIGVSLFPWLAGIIAQSAGFWSLFPFCLALLAAMLCFWLPLRVFSRQSPSSANKTKMVSREK